MPTTMTLETTIMEVIDQKKKLRTEFLAKRDNVSPDKKRGWDANLFDRLINHTKFIEAESILCFVSFRNEPDTIPILIHILEQGKTLFVPRVVSRNEGMEIVEVESLNQLQSGAYGILEPVDLQSSNSTPDLVIVPGLIFTQSGYRIGYGGGFYDRFLAKHPESNTISMVYPFQLIDEMPIEDTDQLVDELIIAEQF